MRLRIEARRKAIDTKNIANNADFIDNNDIAAQTNQRMANQSNLTDTGISGLAARYASPDAVAMSSKLLKDQQAQNSGMAFDQNVANFMRETNQMESDFTNGQTSYYGGLARDAGEMAYRNQQEANKIAMQRNQWIPQAIGLGIGGFSSVFGAVRPPTGGGR